MNAFLVLRFLQIELVENWRERIRVVIQKLNLHQCNVQIFNLSSIITFVSRIERLKDIVSQLQTNGRLSEQIKFSRPNLVWHYFVVRVTTMFSCLASLKEYRWRNPFEMPQDDTIFISLTLVHSINSSQFNFDRNWFI